MDRVSIEIVRPPAPLKLMPLVAAPAPAPAPVVQASGGSAPNKDPSERMLCLVCDEQKFAYEMISLDACGHTYCNDCVREYLKTKITAGDCIDIRCMHPGCRTVMDYSFIKTLLPTELFKKYEEFSLQAALKSATDVRWCPKPGCGLALFGEASQPQMRCTCGHEYCFLCGEDWHVGTCAEYKQWKVVNGKVDKEFEKYAKENTKPCPRCKNAIQKNEGCNHMTCAACHHQFCWLCGADYSPDHFSVYNVMGCPGMQGEENENFGLIRRTLVRVGVASGMALTTAFMVAAGIALPGSALPTHVVVKMWKGILRANQA
jgi:hypothetical protein